MPFDIMPWNPNTAGRYTVLQGEYDTGVPYVTGDLVYMGTDGQIHGFPKDGSPALISDPGTAAVLVGVALSPGVDRSTGTALGNPRTGATFVAGDLVQMVAADRGTLFICQSYQTTIGTSAIPPGTAVGQSYQLTFDNVTSNRWVVEGALASWGAEVQALVRVVLDSEKNKIPASNTTNGSYVVFELRAGGGSETYVGLTDTVGGPSTLGQMVRWDGSNQLGNEETPYDVAIFQAGVPDAGAELARVTFPRSVDFADDFANSEGSVDVNPVGGSVVFTVKKNGVSIGTITVDTSGVFTFSTTAGSVNFADGDYLTIETPVDLRSLEDIGFTLRGTRT